MQRVYVDQFVESVREMLVPETAHYGVELVIEAEYDGTARFDESKVKRVIFNLARNAYDDGLARYRVALTNLQILTGTL